MFTEADAETSWLPGEVVVEVDGGKNRWRMGGGDLLTASEAVAAPI